MAIDYRTNPAVTFILELARALHVYGTPAHDLERALNNVARKLALKAEFFSTPTSLMVGLGEVHEQEVRLIRVEPGSPNLGHLSDLSSITRDVIDGRETPTAGLERLRKLLTSKPRWPAWLVLVASVLASGAVSSFFGVSTGDLFIAAFLGLVTGAITMVTWRTPGLTHVTEPLTAFIVATLAFSLEAVTGRGSGFITTLAGLIILVPGLTFTVALTELSTQHLASGTARMAGAFVVFLGLGFGLALGAQTGAVLGPIVADAAGSIHGPWLSSAPLPPGAHYIGVCVAALAFMVMLHAKAQDAIWILLTCLLAYTTSRFTGAQVGDVLAAFLSALVVTAVSNLMARIRTSSSMVTAVPGLIILVPGSIGLRSVQSLLGSDVELGIATAFDVAIIGIAIAAGIVAGNFTSGRKRSEAVTV